MSAFEDFMQRELPKRPYSESDGLPGQILVRSSNSAAKRELIWKNLQDLMVAGGGVFLTTPNPILISNGRIVLPDTPLGGVMHNMALVFRGLTSADFKPDGSLKNGEYLIEEHINVKVEGNAAVFIDESEALDGLYAQVSYLRCV